MSCPRAKVCPQCQAVVPLRLKVCKCCQHVFRAKRKAERNLPDRAVKRMRALLSDSVKSVIKAKDKLQKAFRRASETNERALHRQQQNREHMANMRSVETSEQTLQRQRQNRERMASMRSVETDEQTLHRQNQDRKRKASMRAVETGEQTLHRQDQDRKRKASMRAAKKTSDVSVEQAIVVFSF